MRGLAPKVEGQRSERYGLDLSVMSRVLGRWRKGGSLRRNRDLHVHAMSTAPDERQGAKTSEEGISLTDR